ncbi:MAG: 6-phosphogluconate dehydrogenase [Haloplasmataceae bacterium]|nr:6-phosphogluconate dehydrogenase [Haloplasmataceae bacterium]
MKRIIVLGGGYGGILTAKNLAKKLHKDNVKITLIDKNPYHTMLTELHEVVAGRVHEDSIKIYFDQVFAGRKVEFVLDEIKNIDFDGQVLKSSKGEYLYDYLVIGTGCKPTFFGKNENKEKVYTLWSLDDSVILHEHIIDQFRVAAKTDDADLRKEILSFVVVGAGFTGVELAGELGEYVPELCRLYHVDRADVSIKLLDMAPRVLPVFPEVLSANAVKKLNKLGVECLTGKPCGEITENSIVFGDQVIKSQSIIWVTGVEGSEVMDKISGVEKKGRGRIVCNKYLQAEGHSNVYVVGDNIFYIPEGEDKPVPQMVENAEHSSELVTNNIVAEIKGIKKEVYRPKFHGAMVSIGGRKGLAQFGSINIKNSFIALFAKHFINVIYFLQILGWTKIWSYVKHEFFHVPNQRSFVGGTFSHQTPLIWTLPLRLWLGFAWFMQGLPKLAHKLTGGWSEYCVTSEMPTNNGLLCDWTGYLVKKEPDDSASPSVEWDGTTTTADPLTTTADTTAAATPVTENPKTETGDLTGFEGFIQGIVNFFSGFKPTESIPGFGSAYNVDTLFDHFQDYAVINILFYVIEWIYNLFMTVSEFFMTYVISYIAPLFEFILALGETGIGVLLILGLFTTIAAFGSLALTLMVIVGSLISYDGIFLSDLVWYLVASIALINIGGNRQVLALDYYVMPKVHAFLQRIPLFKKMYLYGDRIDFTRPTKVE